MQLRSDELVVDRVFARVHSRRTNPRAVAPVILTVAAEGPGATVGCVAISETN
jgi:hypothetical protein